jgi:hypothetical protein
MIPATGTRYRPSEIFILPPEHNATRVSFRSVLDKYTTCRRLSMRIARLSRSPLHSPCFSILRVVAGILISRCTCIIRACRNFPRSYVVFKPPFPSSAFPRITYSILVYSIFHAHWIRLPQAAAEEDRFQSDRKIWPHVKILISSASN